MWHSGPGVIRFHHLDQSHYFTAAQGVDSSCKSSFLSSLFPLCAGCEYELVPEIRIHSTSPPATTDILALQEIDKYNAAILVLPNKSTLPWDLLGGHDEQTIVHLQDLFRCLPYPCNVLKALLQ